VKKRQALRINSTTLTIILLFILLCSIFGITYFNYSYSQNNPGGNDFIPRYLGTRLFLLNGWSPYGEQTTEEIQNAIFGRLARDDEDQSLFVYPMYTVLLVAPFSLISDFALARALWMTALQLCLVITTITGFMLCYWKPPVWFWGMMIIFSLLWYHSVRPLINGNLSIIVALFITLSLLAIQKNQDAMAGFLLSITTIKPQMVILLIPFILLWAVSKKRWSIVGVFFGSLTLLIVLMSLFEPDWLVKNILQVISYPAYTLAGTPGEIFSAWLPGVGLQFGWLLTILMLGILIVEWRLAFGKMFNWFLWAVYLTLTVTNIIGIRTTTANYVALLPALILVFASMDGRWPRIGIWISTAIVIFLFSSLWVLFINTIDYLDQPTQDSIMFFPLPLILLFLLYWIRWWAIRDHPSFLSSLHRVQIGKS